METIKKLLKRKSVIVAVVIGIIAFFLLDTYPIVASLTFIAAIVFVMLVLGFDIDPRRQKEGRLL